MNHPNDEDPPPLALSNEAAQPVRDPQPESSVDAALGNAFTSRGMINLGRYDYQRDYLARNGLIHLGDFRTAASIAMIRSIEGRTPRLQASWSQATGYTGPGSVLRGYNDMQFTEGG